MSYPLSPRLLTLSELSEVKNQLLEELDSLRKAINDSYELSPHLIRLMNPISLLFDLRIYAKALKLPPASFLDSLQKPSGNATPTSDDLSLPLIIQKSSNPQLSTPPPS